MARQKQNNPVLLATWHRNYIYFTVGALWLTGVIFVSQNLGGEFSIFGSALRNSLQSTVMQLHGALMFLFVLGFGSLLHHMQTAWKLNMNKVTGVIVTSILGILLLTAWLLYYASGDSIRWWASASHIILGSALPFLIVFHIARGRTKSGSRPARRTDK